MSVVLVQVSESCALFESTSCRVFAGPCFGPTMGNVLLVVFVFVILADMLCEYLKLCVHNGDIVSNISFVIS